MSSITLSKIDKESKGRNGWFHPAKAQVLYGPQNTIAIEIWSKNQSGEAPIDLYLTPEDAAHLGRVLLAMSPADDESEMIDSPEMLNGLV